MAGEEEKSRQPGLPYKKSEKEREEDERRPDGSRAHKSYPAFRKRREELEEEEESSTPTSEEKLFQSDMPDRDPAKEPGSD